MSKYGHIPQNDFEALLNKMGGEEVMRAFMRGEYHFVPKQKSGVIQVNRSVEPEYPEWARVINPSLQVSGPTSYDVSTLDVWRGVNRFDTATYKVRHIYDTIRVNDGTLENYIGLSDLYAIEEQGVEFFNQFFREKIIYAWKSVVEDTRDKGWRVPMLYVRNEKFTLSWVSLESELGTSAHAPRFRK